MHDYLTSLFWWNAGKYGGILAILGISWLARQTWLPHRHDGYVSMSGYVRKCTRCGKLPEITDPVACSRCGDVRGGGNRPGTPRDLCPACYIAELDIVTCPRCGGVRSRPPSFKPAGGLGYLCPACYIAEPDTAPMPHLWERTAYGRGDGFHYARIRTTDAVERHCDGEPCDCPNAAEYGPDRPQPDGYERGEIALWARP